MADWQSILHWGNQTKHAEVICFRATDENVTMQVERRCTLIRRGTFHCVDELERVSWNN